MTPTPEQRAAAERVGKSALHCLANRIMALRETRCEVHQHYLCDECGSQWITAALLTREREAQEIVDAVMYGMRVDAFPCLSPARGASTEALIRWGAIRNLHDKVASMTRARAKEAGDA